MATEQQSTSATPYIEAIDQYDREFKKWVMRAEKIVKIYRDYDFQSTDARRADVSFNILWANIEVLMPAVFARLPKPDVSRRFRDNDPVGRVAALILERALEYEIQQYPDYRAAMNYSVLDRFLGGRGVAWVRYEYQGGEELAAEGQVTEDQEAPKQYAPITGECSPTDYVHWKDMGHNVARTWEEVNKVWRRVFMDRPALVKRFGEEKGGRIPLDSAPDNVNGSAKDNANKLGCVHEIWDKETGKVVWLCKSLGQVVDEKPAPLTLDNFWPCPRPLYSTLTSDTLIPVPDYKQYQSQAKQLDKLSRKIDGLIDQLKVFGVYDKSVKELARLFKEAGNGDLIPVDNFQQFAEKSGLKGTVDLFDIAPIVAALNEAYAAEEKVKNEIYELVGIADITRGASDPSETYGAQKLKGQYGNMRLRNKQDQVVQFATELLQIKAQIICQAYQPATIMRIAAVDQLDPADQAIAQKALELLMGPRALDPNQDTPEGSLSTFRVAVSSDSMVQMDEQQEKRDRTEFLTAVGGYLEKAYPMAQQSPQSAPVLVGLLKFGITGYKVGKQIEGLLDNALDQLVKQAAQPQPPKPDPEMAKIQAQMQLEDKKLQNAMQLATTKAQTDAQVATNEQQVQAEQNAHQNMLEAERAQMQAQLDDRLEQQRMAFEAAQQAREQQFAQWKEELQAAVKVEVANISSKAKLQDAATDTSTNEIASEVKQ